jgi:hypothetical protein
MIPGVAVFAAYRIVRIKAPSPLTLLTFSSDLITLQEMLRMKHGEIQRRCEVHAMTQYLIGLTIPLEAVAITGLDHDIAIVSKCTVSSEEKSPPDIESLCCNSEVSHCRTVVAWFRYGP